MPTPGQPRTQGKASAPAPGNGAAGPAGAMPTPAAAGPTLAQPSAPASAPASAAAASAVPHVVVPAVVPAVTPPLDIERLRADFPILSRRIHGRRLVYLDSAATSQKPRSVIDAEVRFYENSNANVHRAIHTLGEEATAAYEAVREKVGRLLGGVSPRGVVFTRNASESLNLMAYALARPRLRAGDEILLTEMEHHSNLVPWFLVARATGATLRHIPITDDGCLDLSAVERLLSTRTRVLAFVHKSNVLGTVNPVAELARRAHAAGALVIVDGAQAVGHIPVDLNVLGVDAYAFSSHKMLGPTGVGVLWARPELLESMEPFLGGGEMIREVYLDHATWNDVPWKFEAGTPNIAGVVGLGAAIEYLEALGIERALAHEVEVTRYALERLTELGFLKLYGPRAASDRPGVVAFSDPKVHPHDLSTVLDSHGVAIRAGHHCAQPLMRRLGVVAAARASLHCYNDKDDVDALVDALIKTREYFGHVIR